MNTTLLYAWKTGALDPPDQLRVEEALRRDPTLLARMLALEEPSSAPNDPWRLPRHGWGLQARLLEANVFSERLRPGDRFRVAMRVPDDADRSVVVLRRTDAWHVVFPTDGATLRAGDLPLEGGDRVLDLSTGPDPGLQIWGVALPTPDFVEPGWARLRAAIASGEVPVTQVRIDVVAPG